MARQTKRLNARLVASTDKPGMHADGDGLYLVVDPSGAKRWAFIFQWDGKRKELGLGKLAAVSLADARERAADARRYVSEGRNPIEVRKTEQAAREAGAVTFGSYAEEYFAGIESQFRNPKHKAQWRMTLSVQRSEKGEFLDTGYCLPLRNKRLDDIDTEQVLELLQPIWLKKNETASRLRGRIERVLDAAKVKGYRSGENPARWRGHLDKLLPKRKKLSRGHHPALPYTEAPDFMSRLGEAGGMGAKALRFTILTASRTGEARRATWAEFDLKAGIWTIPGARMKAAREHRVPLTGDSLAIIRELHETRIGDFVFPGQRPNAPISDGTMTKAMMTAGGGAYTVHGMRSTFRDWISEATQFPDNLAEAALAHIVGDETERAYKRGDALAKRRKVMEAWDRYLHTPAKGNVVAIRAANA